MVHDLIGLENDEHASFAVASGDHNNDGFPDFIVNNKDSESQLYENTGGTNNWFKVSLEGTISNRDGIGSWIYLYSNGVVQTRYTLCGEGYLGQNSQREMFGLGENQSIDSLAIHWLSGHVDTFYDLPLNITWHIIEGSSLQNQITANSNLVLCDQDSLTLLADEWESYLWSNGDSTQNITVFEPGTYWLTGINELGIPVVSNEIEVVASVFSNIDAQISNISCFSGNDGAIDIINLLDDQLLNYEWSNGETGLSADSLGAGDYLFMAEDLYGCELQMDFSLSQPSSLGADFQTTDVSCNGLQDGTASIIISGGTPGYFVEWFGIDSNELSAGAYDVQILDTLGCILDSTFTIFEPLLLQIGLTINGVNGTDNGAASISISGGTEPYSIDWSNGETDVFEVINLGVGSFSVLVTDANGCEIQEDFGITTISDDQMLNLISIYPNPCSDHLIIENIPLDCDEVAFQLTESSGRQVQLSWLSQGVIDMENIASGVLILKIHCKDQISHLRILKSQQY
jgi:hypothetical protein